MVFLWMSYQHGLPDWASQRERAPAEMDYISSITTYNLFTFLDASLNLWYISLGIIVDNVDLVFAEDLKGLFCG